MSSPADPDTLIALAAVAASQPGQRDACPDDGTFAAFSECALGAAEHTQVMRHVAACANCYAHWLELGVPSDEPVGAPDTPNDWPRRIGERLGALVAAPLPAFAAGFAAVAVVAMLAWPAPSLHDAVSAEIAAIDPAAAARHAQMPLPWEATVLAFDEAPPGPSALAFGDGLVAAQAVLSNGADEHASNASGRHDALAQDYFELGRWMAALWAQSTVRKALPAASEQALAARFVERFAAHPDNAPGTRMARATTRGIEARIGALASADDAAARRNLEAFLARAMQQLGPSSRGAQQ